MSVSISASTQVVNWYPKKTGPPATVTKNESHTGLHLLWQKHLQQVSKRVGIEQAKVIASDPDFQSPHRLFETYRQAFSTLRWPGAGPAEEHLSSLCRPGA